MESSRSLPIVIVGHVDHGKSTLIGRLLYDTGSLPEEKLEEIRMASEATGREIEFSFAMDHLEEERQRGITIDIAQTFFHTAKRRYVIIDAPGHKEFLKNMITGSSQAEAALLLIDAVEGVREQTRRHCFILGMLGIKQVAVLINKMDLVDYSQERFNTLSQEITQLFNQLSTQRLNDSTTQPIPQFPAQPIFHATIQPAYVIPISARHGANVASRDDRLNWFNGPTVLEALDSFETLEVEDKPLRFPVQDVYDIDGKRIMVGRIEAGRIKKGENLHILPGGEKTTVLSIEKFQEEGIETALTGECIGLCLDRPAVRGEVLVRGEESPRRERDRACPDPKSPDPESISGDSGGGVSGVGVTRTIHANIFWMGEHAYRKGEPVTFKCATQEVEGKIEAIYRRFDPATIEVVEKDAGEIGAAEIAEVEISLEKPAVVDSFTEIPEMGRFVLEKAGHPVAGGIII